MAELVQVVAMPSLVTMQVRVDLQDAPAPALSPTWDEDLADVVDFFVYERCEVCGFDLDGHVVVPGPFGHPFLYCEHAEEG